MKHKKKLTRKELERLVSHLSARLQERDATIANLSAQLKAGGIAITPLNDGRRKIPLGTFDLSKNEPIHLEIAPRLEITPDYEKGHSHGYERGFTEGRDLIIDHAINNIEPLNHAWYQAFSAMVYMDGLIIAGYGEGAKQNISMMIQELAALASKVDMAIDLYRNQFGEASVPFDEYESGFSSIIAYRDAAKQFVNGHDPQGAELLALAKGRNRTMAAMVDLRDAYKPGRKAAMTKQRQELARLYIALTDNTGDGMTGRDAASKIHSDLCLKVENQTAQYWEFQALESLDNAPDAHGHLRSAASEYRRKQRKNVSLKKS